MLNEFMNSSYALRNILFSSYINLLVVMKKVAFVIELCSLP